METVYILEWYTVGRTVQFNLSCSYWRRLVTLFAGNWAVVTIRRRYLAVRSIVEWPQQLNPNSRNWSGNVSEVLEAVELSTRLSTVPFLLPQVLGEQLGRTTNQPAIWNRVQDSAKLEIYSAVPNSNMCFFSIMKYIHVLFYFIIFFYFLFE